MGCIFAHMKNDKPTFIFKCNISRTKSKTEEEVYFKEKSFPQFKHAESTPAILFE